MSREAHLVRVLQELDLSVAWPESPHQPSCVPGRPLNQTFDPNFTMFANLRRAATIFSIGTPSLDKTQLTMGYFDTDYLKCHSFHQIIDQT